MKLKVTLVLVLLGLVLWLAFDRQQPMMEQGTVTSPSLSTEQQNNQQAAKSKPTTENNAAPDNFTHKTVKSQLELTLQEIENRMFSDDPYVELYSLDTILSLCDESFKLEDLLMMAYHGEIYPQQQQAIGNFQSKCATYQARYPNLISMNIKDILTTLAPQSKLGLLIEKKKQVQNATTEQRNTLESQILIEAIRQQNSSLAIEISFNLRFNQPMANTFIKLLNSQDLTYIQTISQLTVAKIACDFQGGQACESSSGIMLLICSQQPDSCGLDYISWFEQNTLPGMKNDVQALTAYYRNLAE